MRKQLIYTDTRAVKHFEEDCFAAMEKCQELLDLFHNFQEFKIINNQAEWIELVSDPGAYFDAILLSNLNLSAGNRKPDAGMAAKLFQIEREAFLNVVAGKPIINESCIPCRKSTIRKGKTSISLRDYRQFQDYLIFDGQFYLNRKAIDHYCDSNFNTYVETQAQFELYTHWQKVCDILNLHDEKYPLSSVQKSDVCKAMRLSLSQGAEGKFCLDEYELAETIKFINHENKS